MKLYEGMFLFDANLASRDWPGLERHVEDLLKRNSATLEYSERWPDKKLAYEIKGCKKGTYYLTYFNAPQDSIVGLHRDCQLSDRVLRLLVLQDEGIEGELEKRRSRQKAEPADTSDSEPAGMEDAGEYSVDAPESENVTSDVSGSTYQPSEAEGKPENDLARE